MLHHICFCDTSLQDRSVCYPSAPVSVRRLAAFLVVMLFMGGGLRAHVVDSLLAEFGQHPSVSVANRLFDVMDQEELMDTSFHLPLQTSVDTLQKHVWYWAAEWYHFIQDYKQAEAYGQKALPLFVRDVRGRIECLHIMAIINFRLSHFESAIGYAKEGLSLVQDLGDADLMSSLHNTTAAIYVAAHQNKEAEKHILLALECADRAGNLQRKAIFLGAAAEIFHTSNQFDKALDYANQACQLEQTLGREGKMAIRLAQRAAVLIGMSRYKEAEADLRKAIPVFRQVGNHQSLAISQNKLGEALYNQGRLEEAKACYHEAIQILSASGDLYNELHAHKGLFETLYQLNHDSAKIELNIYTQLKDSLYSTATAEALARYTAELENDALQHSYQDTVKARKRDSVVFILGILLLVALCVFVVYNRHRLYQKRVEALIREIELLRTQALANQSEGDGVSPEEENPDEPQPDQTAIPEAQRRFLTKVVETVNENLPSGQYGVETIASQMNMSVQTFRRRLMDASGEQPKAFITAIQMGKACKLLTCHPELSVTDVANQCGFEEISSFTRAFKRTFSITPTTYREQAQNQDSTPA